MHPSLLLFLCLSLCHAQPGEAYEIDMFLPGGIVVTHHTRFCTGVKIPDENAFIVTLDLDWGGDSGADVQLFACIRPPTATTPVWDCSIEQDQINYGLEYHPNCGEGEGRVLFGARPEDGKSMLPPPGSGYPIGKDANISAIVMANHYAAHSTTIGHASKPAWFRIQVQPASPNVVMRKAGTVIIEGYMADPSQPNVRQNSYQLVDQDEILIDTLLTHSHVPSHYTFWKVSPSGETTILAEDESTHPLPIDPDKQSVRRGDRIFGRCIYNMTSPLYAELQWKIEQGLEKPGGGGGGDMAKTMDVCEVTFQYTTDAKNILLPFEIHPPHH